MIGNIGKTLQYVEDLVGFRRGLVIHLPGDRALRIGLGVEAWCRLGPRRYEVVIPEHVWNRMVEIMGHQDAEKMRAEIGATLALDPRGKGTPLAS